MSGHEKIIILQLICTNTNCFYKIIIAKLLALNVLSIASYTFENFNNIYNNILYILQNYLSLIRGAPDLEFSNSTGTGFTRFGQKFPPKFRPDLPDLKQDNLG